MKTFYSDLRSFLICLFSLIALDAAATVNSLYGSGTADDPYLIHNVEELEWMRDKVNVRYSTYADKCYKLMSDLNFSGEKDWIPIGSGAFICFSGVFDGNDKVLRNMKIGTEEHPVAHQYAGLFGFVFEGEIKNIEVNWTILHIVSPESYSSYVGGIVGESNNSVLLNSKASGSIYSGNSSAFIESSIGGLVGNNYNSSILNSYTSCDISSLALAPRSEVRYAGGVAGQSDFSIIINSYSTGQIQAASHAGGVVGYNTNGSVINCYSTGNVASSSLNSLSSVAGGIVGENFESIISNCYASGNINSSVSISYSSHAGGIAGCFSGQKLTNCLGLNEVIRSINKRYIHEAYACRIGYKNTGLFSSNFANGSMDLKIGTSESNLDIVEPIGENHGSDLIEKPVDLLNKWVRENQNEKIKYHEWAIIEGVNKGYPVFEDMLTFVENPQSNVARIFAVQGAVIIENAVTSIQVINLSGVTIHQVMKPSSHEQVELNKGFYIICTGNTSNKVFVH